jgi:catechol 2,3-dioxygenase-like lactoylglutathione lyase family enzyme
MPVVGMSAFSLEVPDLDEGVRFYTDAGLEAEVEGDVARFRCPGRAHDCVTLFGGAARKRLHHVRLRADSIEDIAGRVAPGGGTLIPAPTGLAAEGLWLRDPHGTLFHLSPEADDAPLVEAPLFQINAPGRIVRTRRPALRPTGECAAARPLKLGHVVLFTPDVMRSVRFATEVFGMGLADHSEDLVAFCCARSNSDHHVLAFGKSTGIGFHHGSFQLNDPDEVGRAGRALLVKTGRDDWGVGRHTIGSNFFHYVQDPWGSWFEYYADMDHIDDYELWSPTNYPPADSLANWGPPPPDSFMFNAEAVEPAGTLSG